MNKPFKYRGQWKDKAVMRKFDEQYGRVVGKTDRVLAAPRDGDPSPRIGLPAPAK